jgi:MinD-like ATPase involved in chromosome partitioning or flagellar assembly
MTIALLAKKGGVGKSTLTILLHEAFRQAGKSVAIRDWDAQGTSNKALDLIEGQKAHAETRYEMLIYDTPPSLVHQATRAAVQHADIALVVTTPSPADLWEAEDAVRFVQTTNPDTIVRVVFNKVRKGTLLSRIVPESAKQLSVPALGVMLSARECYQHALGQGWKALDGAAREEVLQLTVALLSLQR